MSSSNTEWSEETRSALITGGRQLAEAVLVHVEKLEQLKGDDDLDKADAATGELGLALDRFEDVQLDYCGTGLPFLDLTDAGIYEDEDADDDAEEDEAGSSAEDVEAISVMSRIDLMVTDHEAVRQAATAAGQQIGGSPPEHLGEALYNLTAVGGINQLMETPGIRPVAALTLFTQQPDPFTGQDIDEADISTIFDLESAPVLFAASDVWDGSGKTEEPDEPTGDPSLN